MHHIGVSPLQREPGACGSQTIGDGGGDRICDSLEGPGRPDWRETVRSVQRPILLRVQFADQCVLHCSSTSAPQLAVQSSRSRQVACTVPLLDSQPSFPIVPTLHDGAELLHLATSYLI